MKPLLHHMQRQAGSNKLRYTATSGILQSDRSNVTQYPQNAFSCTEAPSKFANMSNDQYTRVALQDNDAEERFDDVSSGNCGEERKHTLKNGLGTFALSLGIFALGFVSGGTWAGVSTALRVKTNNGLLHPQSFIPESMWSKKCC